MSDEEDRSRSQRRPAFALILVLLLAVTLELISYGFIAVAPATLRTDRADTRLARFSAGAEKFLEQRPGAMAVFHEAFGWRPNVGLSDEVTRINSLGLRSDREYAQTPPDGVLRVAAFGDSFIYGHEVSLENAWPTLVEVGSSDLEVLNFGVTGFGPDQAYLRFAAEAEAVHPDVVIWGISPWMVNRLVSVYRPFLTQGNEFAVKPRYAMGADGRMALLPQPVARVSDAEIYVADPEAFKQLGENDHFYSAAVFENPLHDWVASIRLLTAIATKLNRRYLDRDRILTGPPGEGVFNTESEAFRIAVALMARVDAEVRDLGAIPVILVIPDIHSLRRVRAGVPSIGSPLIDACRDAGLNCWNLPDAFDLASEDAGIDDWFMPGGHYSPEGNAIVAAWMESQLRALP